VSCAGSVSRTPLEEERSVLVLNWGVAVVLGRMNGWDGIWFMLNLDLTFGLLGYLAN
jgi:hypothetical protein